MQQKEIFLEMSNKRISVEVSEEENTNILAEIKRKVFEKENIPEKQQNIYVGGVLLTEKHKNTFVRDQLEKQKFGATLEVLTPAQVALYEAIKALDLPPEVKIRNNDEYLSVGSPEGEYGKALSKALEELKIQYSGNRNKLYIDIQIIDQVVLSDDFAESLKASYKTELAKIKNSLFFVSNPPLLMGSAFVVPLGVVCAVGAGLFVVASVATGGVFAAVAAVGLAVGAALCLGASLWGAYHSIKIGEGGGGGGSPESPTDDPETGKRIGQTQELEKKEEPNPTIYKDVLGQKSTATSTQKGEEHTETLGERFRAFINRL